MVHADHHSREVGRGEPEEDDWSGTGGGGPGEDDDEAGQHPHPVRGGSERTSGVLSKGHHVQ